MSEMPYLGRRYPYRRRRRTRRLVLAVVVVAGAGVAIWRWMADDPDSSPPTAAAPANPAAAGASAGTAAAPTTAPPTGAAPGPGAPATAAPAAGAAAPATAASAPAAAGSSADELRGLGMRQVQVAIAGPLETAFVDALGRELGAPLTQVVTRTLVWWVSVPGDLRPGDVVEALFSERAGAEPLVHAVRFRSAKAGKTFEAYRYQAPGADVARFYVRDGNELELRLEDSPLDDYEQITSLLRDGRGHQGVDFRTPVGTPVKATFDAVFVRRNWNFRANGNCVELRERGGEQRTVYLLHLSEVAGDLKPGERVAKGQVVARSGNTGHSFAPHLHYQLMSRSGRVLDPFASQRTLRRAVPAQHRAAFDAEAARFASLLDRAAAGR